MSPSAWHREDDRELGDPPIVVPCDGCERTVTLDADDARDNDAHYCPRCVAETISRPHPVGDWPEDIPA